jgi:hypothetical protein
MSGRPASAPVSGRSTFGTNATPFHRHDIFISESADEPASAAVAAAGSSASGFHTPPPAKRRVSEAPILQMPSASKLEHWNTKLGKYRTYASEEHDVLMLLLCAVLPLRLLEERSPRRYECRARRDLMCVHTCACIRCGVLIH